MLISWYLIESGFPGGAGGKESTWQCRKCQKHRFDPFSNLIGKIPWSKQWQLTPVFFPRKFHGQRSMEDYSPCGCQEWDTTEHAHIWCDLSHSTKTFASCSATILSLPFLLWPSQRGGVLFPLNQGRKS